MKIQRAAVIVLALGLLGAAVVLAIVRVDWTWIVPATVAIGGAVVIVWRWLGPANYQSDDDDDESPKFPRLAA